MNSKKCAMLVIAAVLFLHLARSIDAQSLYPITTPVQARQTGVTEAAGDLPFIVRGPGSDLSIPAGARLTLAFIPFSTSITNDPVINGTNLVLEEPPDFIPAPVPGAFLEIGPGPNALTITFSQALSLSIGSRLRVRGIRLNLHASGITFPGQVGTSVSVLPPYAIRIAVINSTRARPCGGLHP